MPNHLGFQKLCLGIANVLDGSVCCQAAYAEDFMQNGAVLATTSLNYSNEPPVKRF